jgi:hypothetical protein
MAYNLQGAYNVVEDFDGLHIVPSYRILEGGEILLCTAPLRSCAVFVGTYIRQIAAGQTRGAARSAGLLALERPLQAVHTDPRRE